MNVVFVTRHKSSKSVVNCGVPQGNALGPLLFFLYKADVTMIVHKHGIDANSYENDAQHDFHDKQNSCSSYLPCLALYIDEIDKWMSCRPTRRNSMLTDVNIMQHPAILLNCPYIISHCLGNKNITS